MRIEIHHIPSQGTTLHFEKRAEHFATLKQLMARGECQFITPIQISLQVMPEKDLFKVTGRISATQHLECARCLTGFDAPLNRRFELNYSRQIFDDIQTDESGEMELTAQQIGMHHFKGETIDFTDALQEQVVLSIPYRPLCRETCKGLCARCGADLNEAPCRCESKNDDSPFAVLKNLDLK